LHSLEGIAALWIGGLAVAAYWSLKFVLSIWSGVKAYFLARALGLNVRLSKMGEWAVVTGATDGIGKAYAHEIAKQGLNVVLVSRTLTKLNDVAMEIENKYKVKTRVIAVDFNGGKEIYAKVKKELANLEVGTLINNVGMGYSHPEFLNDVDEDTITNMINCNMLSLTMMTKIVLPQMVERRKGVIVNISSGSACEPVALLTVYSATKAYVDFFSQALQQEYRSKGIIVQDVLPFFVSTKLSKIRRANLMVPSPGTYVRAAMGTIGVQEKTYGCLPHAIQGYVMNLVPSFISSKVSLKMMMGARKAALKKLQQKKE